MSDTFLRLVPADPDYRPTRDATDAAIRVFAGFFPGAEWAKVQAEEEVVFFDAGENSESISCPACGADLEDWWGDAMDAAHAGGFRDLSVTTPCCKTRTSLNDLVYVAPAAFGSIALEVANPGVSSITDAQRAAVEQVMGCPLRVVWQRI